MTGLRVTSSAPQPFPRRAMFAAFALPVVFLAVSSGWMALAPLESAVIVPGVVTVESYRQPIQHLEGGIVDQIKVRDGDQVKRGDVLVQLQDVAVSTQVDRLRVQHLEALAAAARLKAERDGADTVSFGPELIQRKDDPVARNAMTGQLRVFEARRTLVEQTTSVTAKKIAQLQDERAGLEGQTQSLNEQANLLAEEFKDLEELYQRKLLRKSRYLQIKRKKASLEGERAEMKSKLSSTGQKILELELTLSETLATRLSEVAAELQAQSARSYRLARELASAEDRLERTRIRAPIDGTIIGIDALARQGVIAAGQVLMEIVPARESLVVEAKIRPEDIETVRAGLGAHVVMQTLNRRHATPIAGHLERISADRLVDAATGLPFYKGRILFEPRSLQQSTTVPRAGMTAEVFILTGERTPLDYLIAPITKSFSKGLREP